MFADPGLRGPAVVLATIDTSRYLSPGLCTRYMFTPLSHAVAQFHHHMLGAVRGLLGRHGGIDQTHGGAAELEKPSPLSAAARRGVCIACGRGPIRSVHAAHRAIDPGGGDRGGGAV